MEQSREARLWQAVGRGDTASARSLIAAFDRFDPFVRHNGYTLLMHAAASADAGADMLRLLLDAGCDVRATMPHLGMELDALRWALKDGCPAKVGLLIDAGADLHYSVQTYGAVLDAVYGRDLVHDARLIPLLDLLVARGARVNDVSSYGESALRALSHVGRFDAVARLIEAGADESQLAWTPLMRATALGSRSDMLDAIGRGADLEARDRWERTAWHVAIKTGDVGKAELLRAAGANVAARARCGHPALFFAIESGHTAMLEYLLALGLGLDEVDDFGTTALTCAVQHDRETIVDVLIRAGVDVDEVRPRNMPDMPGMPKRPRACDWTPTALWSSESPRIVRRLLDAGADPQHLTAEARRALLNLPAQDSYPLEALTPEQVERGRLRRFGRANPERIQEPFWDAMIAAGVTGYTPRERFALPFETEPVWCAHRFGQSLTFLPDGRAIGIGGEHEDSYDPDFCIYNDVFVHHPDGRVDVYGYPENVFPPTDFHTATLVGSEIVLIGSLGYAGTRQPDYTPVRVLDTQTLAIRTLETTGTPPGWISRHRADRIGEHEIRVAGGQVIRGQGEAETYEALDGAWVLDLRTLAWRTA